VCVCVCVCVWGGGQQENDGVKKHDRVTQVPSVATPLALPKRHHSRPPANPRLPCGAGVSLDDCLFSKVLSGE